MAREIAIISTARSGTTQLTHYLRQVPGVRCFGEVFSRNLDMRTFDGYFANDEEAHTQHQNDLTAFWDRIVAHNSDAAFVGAKIFYLHRPKDPIWRHLQRPEVFVIHLIRDRIFDGYISLARAHATGRWHERIGLPDAAEDAEIQFDINDYLKRRRKCVQAYARVRKTYEHHPHYIELKYEEISDPVALGQKLSGFLGLECAFNETLKKQARRDAIDYVVNRGEALPFVDDTISGLR